VHVLNTAWQMKQIAISINKYCGVVFGKGDSSIPSSLSKASLLLDFPATN
jgi:hypothetical protein